MILTIGLILAVPPQVGKMKRECAGGRSSGVDCGKVLKRRQFKYDGDLWQTSILTVSGCCFREINIIYLCSGEINKTRGTKDCKLSSQSTREVMADG